MCMRKHVDYILQLCNQYFLTQPKRQGLPQVQLQSVFDAIILACIMLVFCIHHLLVENI